LSITLGLYLCSLSELWSASDLSRSGMHFSHHNHAFPYRLQDTIDRMVRGGILMGTIGQNSKNVVNLNLYEIRLLVQRSFINL
jgi:hypothetical protein